MDKYIKDQLIRRTRGAKWKSKKRKSKRKSKQKNKKKKTRTKHRNTKKKLYKKTRKKRMKGGSGNSGGGVSGETDQFVLSPPFGLFDYQKDTLDQDQVNIILKYYMKHFYGFEPEDLSKGVTFDPTITQRGADAARRFGVRDGVGLPAVHPEGDLNIMTQFLNSFPNPMLLYLFNLLEQLYFVGNRDTFITRGREAPDMQGEVPASVEKSWHDQQRHTRAAIEADADVAARAAPGLQTQLTEAISRAEAAAGAAAEAAAEAAAAAEAGAAAEAAADEADEAAAAADEAAAGADEADEAGAGAAEASRAAPESAGEASRAAEESAAEASREVDKLQTQLDDAISRSGRVSGPGVLDVDFANVSWPNYWTLGETKGIAKIAQIKELDKEKKRLQIFHEKIQERAVEPSSSRWIRPIGVKLGLTNSWEDTQRENTMRDLALLELQTIEDRYMDRISAILQSIPELQSLDEGSLLNRAGDEKIDIDIFARPWRRGRVAEELGGSINALWELAKKGLGGCARSVHPLLDGATYMTPEQSHFIRTGRVQPLSIGKTHRLFTEKMFSPFTRYADPTAVEGRGRSSTIQIIIATRIERILTELNLKKSEIDPNDFDIEVIEGAIGNIEMLEKENAYPLSEIPNCLLRFNNLPTKSNGQIGSSKIGNSTLLDIGPEPGEENFFLRNMIYQAMGFAFESSYIFCAGQTPFSDSYDNPEGQGGEQIPSPLLENRRNKHSEEFPQDSSPWGAIHSAAHYIVRIITRLRRNKVPKDQLIFSEERGYFHLPDGWDPWPLLNTLIREKTLSLGEEKLLDTLPPGILKFDAGIAEPTEEAGIYEISENKDLWKYIYVCTTHKKLTAPGFFTKSGMLYARSRSEAPFGLKPDFDVKLIQNFQLFANYSLRKSKLLESIKRDHEQGGGMDAGAAGAPAAGAGAPDAGGPDPLDPGTASPPPLHEKLPEPFVINKEINELFLFHGTSQKVVNEILQFNFDAEFNTTGLYGKYCYFTNHLCKALQYSEPFVYREEILFLQRVGQNIASQEDTITVTFKNNTHYTLYFTNDGELLHSCPSSSTFDINKTISEKMTINVSNQPPEDTGSAGGSPEGLSRLDFSFVVDTIYTTMDVAVIVRKDYRWPVFLSRVIMGPNPFTTYIPLVGLEGESRIKDLPSALSRSEFTLGKSHTEGESTSIFAQGLDDKTRDSYPVTTNSNQVLIKKFSAHLPVPPDIPAQLDGTDEIIHTHLTVPRVKNASGKIYIPRMPRPEGGGYHQSFEARAAGGHPKISLLSASDADSMRIASREVRKTSVEFKAAKEAVLKWATNNDTDNVFGVRTKPGTPENAKAHQLVTDALRVLSLKLGIGPTSVKDWVKFFESNKKNLSETFKTLLEEAEREIKLDGLLSDHQTATCITEAKDRCSELGYGEDCLHFPLVPDAGYHAPAFSSTPDTTEYPELICYLKGQDYKPGDRFFGVNPGASQIHNEFMVANCQENVYMEYLLLFKYATWNDIQEIYIPFVCEGYVIYKPPS